MKTVLIAGYFGFDNFGDELLLESLNHFPPFSPHLTVLSAHPRRTLALHGLHSVNRWNPWKVWHEMREAKALVFAGGSLFQSQSSRRSLSYYFELFRLARLHRLPVALWNQGLGPFQDPEDIRTLEQLITQARHVSIRDSQTFEWAACQWGSKASSIQLGADPTWLLPLPRISRDEAIRTLGWEHLPQPLIGIALKPFTDRTAAGKFLDRLISFQTRYSGTLILLASHAAEDLPVCRTVGRLLGKTSPVRTLTGNFDGCRMIRALHGLFSTRLHPLMIGWRFGLPLLAQSRDPKIIGFLRDVGLDQALWSPEREWPSWPHWPTPPEDRESFASPLTARVLATQVPLIRITRSDV